MSNSPPNICDFSFSALHELTQQYISQHSKDDSKRERQRIKWMHLVTQYQKCVSIEDMLVLIKIKSLIKKLRILRLRVYFDKYRKLTQKHKWCKLQTKFIQRNNNERFTNYLLKFRDLRVRQSRKTFLESPEIALPDLNFLVKNTYSAEPIHSLRGEGKYEKVYDPNQRYKRRDALFLYALVFLLSLLLGLFIYKCNHSSLYRFLSMKDPNPPMPADEDSLFNTVNSPQQKQVIDQVLKIA